MLKLDDVTANYENAQAEIAELTKHLEVFESEKKQFMIQKHKDMVDTFIASKRDEMGKDSDFLEYCLTIDYAKEMKDIEKEVKEIHYNFMLKKNTGGKKKFEAIETETVGETSEYDVLVERYGEDVAKFLKK